MNLGTGADTSIIAPKRWRQEGSKFEASQELHNEFKSGLGNIEIRKQMNRKELMIRI